MVARGVRPGAARPQPAHQMFVGVVQEHQQRVQAEALAVRLGALLVGVRGHEGGVDVQDRPAGQRPAVHPDPGEAAGAQVEQVVHAGADPGRAEVIFASWTGPIPSSVRYSVEAEAGCPSTRAACRITSIPAIERAPSSTAHAARHQYAAPVVDRVEVPPHQRRRTARRSARPCPPGGAPARPPPCPPASARPSTATGPPPTR